jgi:hypothetical protein
MAEFDPAGLPQMKNWEVFAMRMILAYMRELPPPLCRRILRRHGFAQANGRAGSRQATGRACRNQEIYRHG